MSDFRLIAHGKGFDVDRYLSSVEFVPTRVWHEGKPSHFEDIATTSGFEVVLGYVKDLDFDEQEEVAIHFLASHYDELEYCGNSVHMQHFMLFLHFRIELTDDLCGFTTSICRRLLELALALGIEPIIFVDLERAEDW